MSADRAITDRYTTADHQRRESARAAHYDLLRESGYDSDRARREAAVAADKQVRALDVACERMAGATGHVRAGTGRPCAEGSLITPWPWASRGEE